MHRHYRRSERLGGRNVCAPARTPIEAYAVAGSGSLRQEVRERGDKRNFPRLEDCLEDVVGCDDKFIGVDTDRRDLDATR